MPPLYAFEVAEVRLADLLAGLSRVADLGFGLPMGDLCKAGHRVTSWWASWWRVRTEARASSSGYPNGGFQRARPRG
jgi:hypothetical protein